MIKDKNNLSNLKAELKIHISILIISIILLVVGFVRDNVIVIAISILFTTIFIINVVKQIAFIKLAETNKMFIAEANIKRTQEYDNDYKKAYWETRENYEEYFEDKK